MGNFIFCILHLFAIVFGFIFLFITIPAHLIYSGVSRKPGPPITPEHVPDDTICPNCNALVTGGARYCWSCGGKAV